MGPAPDLIACVALFWAVSCIITDEFRKETEHASFCRLPGVVRRCGFDLHGRVGALLPSRSPALSFPLLLCRSGALLSNDVLHAESDVLFSLDQRQLRFHDRERVGS